METQPISITRGQSNRTGKRTSFRRLFIWYCIGVLTTAIAATLLIQLIGFAGIILRAHGRSPLFADSISQIIGIGLITIVPVGALTAALAFFAWRMGQKISHPVRELMQAVEQIRQQNLDFTMTYHANNELGDLCLAFDGLRSELRASLEREWRKQEEIRMQMIMLSHDLRTPATILQGHIEGLTRAEPGLMRSQRLEHYLPALQASSQRMARLLNDLLLVAEIEQAGIVIQPQSVRLGQELQRKAQVYQLQAAAQQIEFALSGQHSFDAPSCVALDLHRMEQILDNLIENALHFTPPHGQIRLTYSYDASSLSLTVRDTGSGIAPQDLPHVFEKFYHSQPPPGEKIHSASGIGLYTCKLLVEKLGGAITIENHPDGGCIVTLGLPLGACGALLESPGSRHPAEVMQ